MFRRTGKNHEKESPAPFYKEESATYLYGSKNSEVQAASQVASSSFSSAQNESSLESKKWHGEKTSTHPFQALLKEEIPETTLGEGVVFRGELSFERLLRIDGTFEGELLSQGKVIVGPKGIVKANLNLREAIIEGKVDGNVNIQERLELRGKATIYGDIRAKNMIVDEGVSIVGHVEISPQNVII
jgi:cytoskeletal protein CcmA (bactofilin family)